MKKDKKVNIKNKIDKNTIMELSKSAFDIFLHIAGNTQRPKEKCNKKK
jgi:hypothetical protein